MPNHTLNNDKGTSDGTEIHVVKTFSDKITQSKGRSEDQVDFNTETSKDEDSGNQNESLNVTRDY